MNDDDDLVLRAKRTAAELNSILDRLADHGVDCCDVLSPHMIHNGSYNIKRVQLTLVFKAETPERRTQSNTPPRQASWSGYRPTIIR